MLAVAEVEVVFLPSLALRVQEELVVAVKAKTEQHQLLVEQILEAAVVVLVMETYQTHLQKTAALASSS